MAELAADDPQEIGGYRLLGRLGSGGMGRVYLARSQGGRTVAVKLIRSELASEAEFRSRFRLEVDSARRVGERWTAPVLDADTEAELPWVATGYIAGPSLARVMSKRLRDGEGPLPERSIRTLAYGLASALIDIHGAGLVHRDLKPSNILITIDGPRVIDFGIARAVDGVPGSTRTNTGAMMGSPSYMSPEQVRSAPVTPASDVFCMASVLAYAATGRPPFGDGSGSGGLHAVMFSVAQHEPDLAGVPEPLYGLVRACLAKQQADRPSPQDIVAAVQPVSLGSSSTPWLPATLIAELGRHAMQLLDTDTPPSGADPPGELDGTAAEDAHAEHDPYAQHGEHARTVMEGRAEPAHGGREDAGPGHASGGAGSDTAAVPTGRAAANRRRPARRWTVAALAAVLVAGAGYAVSGAQLPFLGSGSGHRDGSSGVPRGFVGTWSGAVDRDGEPTGQYRSFVISEGDEGEIVANSTSLGRSYECRSDGTLRSGGKALVLDTKVVKSVPKGRCSALGRHRLTQPTRSTLVWESAGRHAVLHRVATPVRLPKGYSGTWQRPLPDGGTQRMRLTRPGAGEPPVSMVSSGPGEHCEADADLFPGSGTTDRGERVRIGPLSVDEAASNGECATGGSSTLRLTGDRLVREFPGHEGSLTYTRVR